ncbi:MAG: pantoate--beta-alanine ligase [Candidatus Aminicenantes bacterium]|nr:pantoate--beta-alanine ligase [Candidatus Aminicenantes bacterium]
MKKIAAVERMKAAAGEIKTQGRILGFVPTMGYLHEGHLSLVRESLKKADATVVSIFVNPLQFGPREDFRRYPRDPERDEALLEEAGVDILFHPADLDMVPDGFRTTVEVSGLQDKLCGRSRPGHFKGVATVVLKLFNIVRPDYAFFGQKDAQQAIILRRMTKDLDLDTKIEIRPIVREEDGLALSSRNMYLNPEERRAALVLFRSLKKAHAMWAAGEREAGSIRGEMLRLIGSEPLARVDYVEIVDSDTLETVDRINGKTLVAVAVLIGNTRLIDNTILGGKGEHP